MTPSWGIDPGSSGAAALVTWPRPMTGPLVRYARKAKGKKPDGRYGKLEPSLGVREFDALAAYYWRPCVAGFRITDMHGESWVVPSLLAVAQLITARHPEPAHVSIEGVYVGKNPRDALTLAESIGELRRPFMDLAIGEVLRPQGTEWRAKMLRCASATADAFKALSIAWSPDHIAGGLGHLAQIEHATDAGHIACFDAVGRAGLHAPTPRNEP